MTKRDLFTFGEPETDIEARVTRFPITVNPDALQRMIEDYLRQRPHYQGAAILPAGYGVEIIRLQPERFEPDIEDTP